MVDHPTASLFWATVTERGQAQCIVCQLPHVSKCAGRIQAHHVVPKQRLRIELGAETPLWDIRNGVPICERHHHLVTMAMLRLPVSIIPTGVFEFAEEHGLAWSLDRDLEPQEERLFG